MRDVESDLIPKKARQFLLPETEPLKIMNLMRRLLHVKAPMPINITDKVGGL